MRRHLLLLPICLAAGLPLAIAVAWGCAAGGRLVEQLQLRIVDEPAGAALPVTWVFRRACGFGREQVAFTQSSAGGLKRVSVPRGRAARSGWPNWAPLPGPTDCGYNQTILHAASGWPLRCLRATCLENDLRWVTDSMTSRVKYFTQGQQGLMWRPPAWQGALVLEDQSAGGPFSARVLPVRPIVPGLLANTAFWGGALWIVLSAALAGGRRLSRRLGVLRGSCPDCGYDLRGAPDAGCPECGWGKQ